MLGRRGWGQRKLGNVPRSISTPSRNMDKLLPPLPFINDVSQLSSRLIQKCMVVGRAGLSSTMGEGGEVATAVEASKSGGLVSGFS